MLLLVLSSFLRKFKMRSKCKTQAYLYVLRHLVPTFAVYDMLFDVLSLTHPVPPSWVHDNVNR
jgi:hypothetical protein